MVGLTFAAFGILHAVAQAFFTEPTTRRFGERGAILLGVACDCAAFVAMALITKGWMVFAIMILFTAGGIALPAFQSLLSRQVERGASGRAPGDAGQHHEPDRGDRADRRHEHLRRLASLGSGARLDRGGRPLCALRPGHPSADGGVSGEVGRDGGEYLSVRKPCDVRLVFELIHVKASD